MTFAVGMNTTDATFGWDGMSYGCQTLRAAIYEHSSFLIIDEIVF